MVCSDLRAAAERVMRARKSRKTRRQFTFDD